MNKFLSLMGFAKKAGKLVAGSNAVLRSVLSGQSYMVIVTTSGGSIKEKFSRLCKENDIEYVTFGNQEELEKAVGEKNKVIYSIEDEGFAKRLKEIVMGVQ